MLYPTQADVRGIGFTRIEMRQSVDGPGVIIVMSMVGRCLSVLKRLRRGRGTVDCTVVIFSRVLVTCKRPDWFAMICYSNFYTAAIEFLLRPD